MHYTLLNTILIHQGSPSMYYYHLQKTIFNATMFMMTKEGATSRGRAVECKTSFRAPSDRMQSKKYVWERRIHVQLLLLVSMAWQSTKEIHFGKAIELGRSSLVLTLLVTDNHYIQRIM